MKYRAILFLTFCAVFYQSLLAQTDMYYVSHMKDVLKNSYENGTSITCIGVDSISNYSPTNPELCRARVFRGGTRETIDVFGTICFADMDDSGLVLCLRKLPCCDGNMVSYLWCQIGKNNTIVDTICKMSYTTATILPRPIEFKSAIVAIKITEDCEIRSSPLLDNDSMYYELRQQGNSVASLNKGAEVYVIASHQSGSISWHFVAIKYNNCVREAFAERDDKYIFGWLQDTDSIHIQKVD